MTNIVNNGNIHSPYTLSDKTIRSSSIARQKGYSDLDLSLRLHPIRKDIVPLKDDQALKNSVKNLILTNFFERPFQSNLGGNLRGILFEPADAITELALEDNIKRVLKKEPRIKTLFVEVTDLADNNAYRITVKFLIKQFDTASQVEIVLRRLR